MTAGRIHAMTSPTDRVAVQHLMATVFRMQHALVALAPEYKWRGLGNLLGDYGEYMATVTYGLTKAPAGSNGFDAVTADGRTVQIKANRSSDTIGIRGTADLLLVLGVNDDAEIEEIYFGDFEAAVALGNESKRDNKISITVTRLRALAKELSS